MTDIRKRLNLCVKPLFFLCLALGLIFNAKTAKAADPAVELVNPKLLATYDGIEIYGEESYSFIQPYEGMMIINLKLVNTTDKYQYLRYDASNDCVAKDKNAKTIVSNIQTPCTHPSPNWFFFQPKEERMMQLALYYHNPQNVNTTVKNAPFSVSVEFTHKDVIENKYESSESTKHTLTVDFTVTNYAYKTALKGKKMATATVSGYVQDSKGNPIQYATVNVNSGCLEYGGIRTDAKGYFSVKVAPYYSKYRKKWNTYVIEVSADGYQTTNTVITPKKNKTIKKTIKLAKAAKKVAYKQTKVVDTNIQVYDLDASADGSVIATVPFHTLLPEDQLKGKTKMVVASKTGKIYFEKELPTETPMVYVSDDGKYIVVVNEYAGSWESNAVIYDINGNEVYKTPDKLMCMNPYTGEDNIENGQRCWCAVLSKNNKLLALGSCDGDLWVYDWQNDKRIWSAAPQGQVRTIDFSDDDKYMYVTAGGGYVYCYDVATGKEVWRNFVMAWGTQAIVTSKYFVVTTKADGYSLFVIDRFTGKTVWDYPTITRGCALTVSKDETLLFWGSDNGTAYTPANAAIFDLDTGKLKQVYNVLGDYSAQGAVFSEDGKQILIKSSKGFGIYNVKTGAPVYEKKVVSGDGQNAYSLSFSLYATPDFKYVVAGFNDDPSFRFWGQLYFFKKTK